MEKVRLARGGLSPAGDGAPAPVPSSSLGATGAGGGHSGPGVGWHRAPKWDRLCAEDRDPGIVPALPLGCWGELGSERPSSLVPPQEGQSGRGRGTTVLCITPKHGPGERGTPATPLSQCWDPCPHLGGPVPPSCSRTPPLPSPHPALAFLRVLHHCPGGPWVRDGSKPPTHSHTPAPMPGRAAPALWVPQSCQPASAPLGTPPRPKSPPPIKPHGTIRCLCLN